MTVQTLTKKQEEMNEKIRENAEKLGLIKQKPCLEPVLDGVADIAGYLASKPKIMWVLKEPWGDTTPSGMIKNRLWSFTEFFQSDTEYLNAERRNQKMWELMMQINYAIRNKLEWDDIPPIDERLEMIDELRKMAYINLSKMPGEKSSNKSHLKECYSLWKDIVLEQIKLYEPDIIIFGYTFEFFKDDLQITSEPIFHVDTGDSNADTYKKENMILIDAYHPSRKGGEYSDGKGKAYVTAVVKAARKAMEQ